MPKAKFKECVTCKPPKRHPGCQDECPDYQRDRAELDRKNAIVFEAKMKEKRVNDYQAGAYRRMKNNRGNNFHAK